MKDILNQHSLILMEAAIVEQLRRGAQLPLHHSLLNAALIYDDEGRAAMASLYQNYMDLAHQAGLPMLVCTPTWRASRDRVEGSDVSDSVNEDAVAFMREIRSHDEVYIGGLMGCKNDCYRPDEGLDAEAAEQHHGWQIERLADSAVDFLMAATLPNVQEALGIARAMAATGTPYIISFVTGRDGNILDGSSLQEAMALLDSQCRPAPLGYMVNCAHPSFVAAAAKSGQSLSRLIGVQANASALDHSELDNADELKVDSIAEWGELMLALNRDHGVSVLGGCCGTGVEHLSYLLEQRSAVSPGNQ
jgi:S-methylmethionine-dependent homocysteine/selenocysteine methylase